MFQNFSNFSQIFRFQSIFMIINKNFTQNVSKFTSKFRSSQKKIVPYRKNLVPYVELLVNQWDSS